MFFCDMNERRSAQWRGTRQNAIASSSSSPPPPPPPPPPSPPPPPEMLYIFPLCDGEALLYDFLQCFANWFQIFELTNIYFSSFRGKNLVMEKWSCAYLSLIIFNGSTVQWKTTTVTLQSVLCYVTNGIVKQTDFTLSSLFSFAIYITLTRIFHGPFRLTSFKIALCICGKLCWWISSPSVSSLLCLVPDLPSDWQV